MRAGQTVWGVNKRRVKLSVNYFGKEKNQISSLKRKQRFFKMEGKDFNVLTIWQECPGKTEDKRRKYENKEIEI